MTSAIWDKLTPEEQDKLIASGWHPPVAHWDNDVMPCPRCDGQEYDRGSCSLCDNTGLLDEDGDPVHRPPGPYAEMTPVAFVRLRRASRNRRRYG